MQTNSQSPEDSGRHNWLIWPPQADKSAASSAARNRRYAGDFGKWRVQRAGRLKAPAHRAAHELLADALASSPSSPDTVGRATLITSRKPGAAAIPTAETLAVSQLDSSLQRSRT